MKKPNSLIVRVCFSTKPDQGVAKVSELAPDFLPPNPDSSG